MEEAWTDADLFATCIASRKIIRAGHQRVNHTEVHAHVAHGLAAHWTCVVVASVLRKTVTVHEMPTWQLLQQNKSVTTRCVTTICVKPICASKKGCVRNVSTIAAVVSVSMSRGTASTELQALLPAVKEGCYILIHSSVYAIRQQSSTSCTVTPCAVCKQRLRSTPSCRCIRVSYM